MLAAANTAQPMKGCAQSPIQQDEGAGKKLTEEEEGNLRTLGHQLAMHAVAARPSCAALSVPASVA